MKLSRKKVLLVWKCPECGWTCKTYLERGVNELTDCDYIKIPICENCMDNQTNFSHFEVKESILKNAKKTS